MSGVTITDVAERVGVSVATVSRFLSGFNVRQEEAIRSAIIELNYRPSAAARNLKSGRTGTLAVIVPDITNPFFASVVKGIEQAAGDDHMVLLVNTNNIKAREEQVLGALFGRVDGVILVPVIEEDEGPSFFSKFGLPIVLVDRITHDGESFDSVLADNAGGARMATEHLISHGHTNIAIISGPLSTTPGKLRHDGFIQTMKSAHLPVEKTFVIEADFSQEGGFNAMRQLLNGEERPTAVFSANNLMTIGALEAIRESGLRIPEDISIIGFDDFEMASLITPPLTVIARDAEAQGREAMEILISTISSKKQVSTQHRTIPVQLVERGSCATPRSGSSQGSSSNKLAEARTSGKN